MRMLMAVLTLIFACAYSVVAQGNSGNSWLPVLTRAVRHSKLTTPEGIPFHLEAKIMETTNPESDYRATVEEDWVSREKWRRTVNSPEFSQTLVVNGEAVSEKDQGDYFPLWLGNIMTALIDPMPGLATPTRTDPHAGDKLPHNNATSVCTGGGAGSNRWQFCLDPKNMVPTSVILDRSDYEAEFSDFQSFGKLLIARQVISNPEPGTTIQATIAYLTELQNPDEQMFAVDQPTPVQDRISSAWLDETTFRSLVETDMTVDWPAVGSGLIKGGCAVYVSTDRSGHIQEVWPGGCDNAGLEDPLREIVKKWRLKIATSNGVPVQVGARLTFPFVTTLSTNQVPLLTDAEARALATKIVEPKFPRAAGAKGAKVLVEISIDETGKYTGIENTHNVPTAALGAADAAIRQWSFSPYMRDGKPRFFHAEIVFTIH